MPVSWRVRFREETGQVFVVIALTLPVLLGMAAIVIDLGDLFFQKRTLSGAADAAALSAGYDLAKRNCNSVTDPCYAALGGAGGTLSTTAGHYSGRNAGTATTASLPKCTGVGDMNCYTWPYNGDWNRVEVKLKKPVSTSFARIFGISQVNVSARAVASLRPGEPPPFSFVALNTSCDNHTLILQVGGRLAVTSGIYVNSCNDHDGFDIKGDKDTNKGELTAPVIQLVGGWEVYDPATVVRVGSGANCPIPPEEYRVGIDPSGGPCPEMGMPILDDPFDGKIALPQLGDTSLGSGPTVANCGGATGTSAAPRACVPPSGATLQPGTYYGGICLGTLAACTPYDDKDSLGLKPCNAGTASVTLAAGTYIMAGGGFWVCGTSSLSAPDVMVYNTENPPNKTTKDGRLARVVINTKGTVDFGPQNGGQYEGLTVFQNPALSLKSTGGIKDSKCGSTKAEDADIAFRSLGPNGAPVTTYGPYEDSKTELKGDMPIGSTSFKAKDKNKFVVGDHIKIGNEEFIVTAVNAAGDVITVSASSTALHKDKATILIAPATTTTPPGEWFHKVSGTIYAHAQRALFATEEIRGTSNLAVIAGCIRIQGGDNTFDFQSQGLFGVNASLSE